MSENSIRLTQYSHGAGYGCKVSPGVSETVLHSKQAEFVDPNLLVGSETRGDAAVHDLGNGTSVANTTDFFMPIVDDSFDFGHIVATDAISDIFTMGGKPVMVIAIPSWPINRPSPEIAREVTEGGRYAYRQVGIALANNRSIDAPEPIFGLAVAGVIPTERVEKSSVAQAGCKLFLTKPLEIGALTAAEKKSLLKLRHQGLATGVMCRMNTAGASFTSVEGVKAMTDVTGFGLLGYLSEMCQGAGMQARIDYGAIPKLPRVEEYIKLGAVPGGTERNFASYDHLMDEMPREVRDLLCDPQASGDLLLTAMPETENEVRATAAEFGIKPTAISKLVPARGGHAMVEIR